MKTKSINVRQMKIGEGIPKICVPIIGTTTQEFVDLAMNVKESCADLAEIRIDWHPEAKNKEAVLTLLAKIRECLPELPLLATFRTAKEGGNTEINDDDYEKLNQEIIKSGYADMIDVELMRGDEILKNLVKTAHEKSVKIVASNHDFHKTPDKEEIINRIIKMDELGADILKIAVYPKSRQDVLTLMEATVILTEDVTEKPVVTMSMGELGLLSRLSGELSGSSITFGALGKESAPGQIKAERLQDVLKVLHTKTKKNIYFVGFMGAGKSTVARKLAKMRKGTLIEMDETLEEKEGMSIRDMFAQYGENYFRDKESALLEELSQKEHCMVSCGGGVMLRETNIAVMKRNGYIIYLAAKPETIYERVKDSTNRPILNGNMNVSYIKELMDKRCGTYEKESDYQIATDGKSLEEICKEINNIIDCL